MNTLEIAGIKIESGFAPQNKRAPRSEFHKVLDELVKKGDEAIGLSFVVPYTKVQTIRNIAKDKNLDITTNVVSKDETTNAPLAARVWFNGVKAPETSEGETSEGETASE